MWPFKKKMKDSEILQIVRDRFYTNNNAYPYICSEIINVTDNSKQGYKLREWIRSMLGESMTLEGWLSKQRRNTITIEDIWNKEKRLETRLAWLDWIIEYCQNEEANQVSLYDKMCKHIKEFYES